MHYYVIPGIPRGTTEIKKRVILDITTKVMQVSHDEMQKKTRKRTVVHARMLTSHMLRTRTDLTLKDIAEVVYGPRVSQRRDKGGHDNVIHMLQTHEDLMYADEEYQGLVKQAHTTYERKGIADITTKLKRDSTASIPSEREEWMVREAT